MSQTPTRATRAEELVARLTTIADAEELNEWGIRRLERDARVLMSSDPGAAHTVLGRIASLEGGVAKFADRIVNDDDLMTDPGLNFTLVFIGTKTNGGDTHAVP